jgi:hypothetical protein
MDTSRTTYSIDAQNAGSDVAGETAAAMAAASIVFQTSDLAYSQRLFDTATQVRQNMRPVYNYHTIADLIQCSLTHYVYLSSVALRFCRQIQGTL